MIGFCPYGDVLSLCTVLMGMYMLPYRGSPCSLMCIINRVVRALNADWLKAMVYHGYDKTFIFFIFFFLHLVQLLPCTCKKILLRCASASWILNLLCCKSFSISWPKCKSYIYQFYPKQSIFRFLSSGDLLFLALLRKYTHVVICEQLDKALSILGSFGKSHLHHEQPEIKIIIFLIL